MADKHRLAELQMAIMHVLWAHKEATVAQVRESLGRNQRHLAHTTVATMLSKMEKNGQVARRSVGKTLLYRPAIRQETVQRRMLSDLAGRLFRGDVTSMVSHLLDGHEVSADELTRLRKLIDERERQVRDHQ